jgi:hypothetical protein
MDSSISQFNPDKARIAVLILATRLKQFFRPELRHYDPAIIQHRYGLTTGYELLLRFQFVTSIESLP